HLQDGGGQGGEYGEGKQDEDVPATLVVVAAAEHGAPHGDAGHERDPHGHGRGDRADEDVPVLDVADLVGQHALQLVPRQGVQDSLGDGHGRVVGVAPGGEGVGLGVGAHVEL